MHMPAFRAYPDILELTAVCDVREDAAGNFAASAGETVRVFTDFDKMIETGGIDAVDLCTPHNLHAPHAIAAAKAGKHVLVEKPMACSVEECLQMVEAAEAAGVTLMVAQVLRYVPGNVGARKLIDSGELGQVWWARADTWAGGGSTERPGHEWMRDVKRSGGGVLHMAGTHHVDLFRFYFGDVRAVRAHCWGDKAANENGGEDRAVATLEFKSGVVAHLTAGRVASRTPHLFQWMVFGDAGTLYTTFPEDPNGGRMNALLQHHAPAMVSSAARDEENFAPVAPVAEATFGQQRFVAYEVRPPFASPWANEIVHFASCIREGTEPISSGRDNLGTMKAVYACYESARSRKEVHLAHMWSQ
jgi:predicted dehydrogenase